MKLKTSITILGGCLLIFLFYICNMSFAKKQMNSKVPKYKQIISFIENAIIIGELKTGDQLPSLNNLRNKFKLSRDTVITAFNELRARGVIYSVVGKGYYVKTIDIKVQVKILLLFDELNSFKEDLYNSFLEELEDDYQIDIFFHHFNFDLFKKIIDESAGNYGYYVIMPANFSGVAQILRGSSASISPFYVFALLSRIATSTTDPGPKSDLSNNTIPTPQTW